MYAVIMAGGRGARFWPKSRSARPKQLLDIAYRRTMLQATVDRVLPLVPHERIVIVTGTEQAALLREQVPEIPPENILVEPAGRNTAPCICMAALHIAARDPQSIMTVLPSDHYIERPEEFRETLLRAAEEAACGDVLVTVGIRPQRPETGYGYMQYAPRAEAAGGFAVERFYEKPDVDHARRLIAQKNVVWNSGMFVWRTQAILDAIHTHLPDMYRSLAALDRGLSPPDYRRSLDAAYAAMQSISIDYGVLEKASNVKTVPGDFGWNDIGSWSAVYDLADKDAAGNVFRGEVQAVDANNVFVDAPGKMTAVIGVQDLVIVDTGDCLLVCARERAQDVRKIVSMLEREGRDRYL